MVEAGAVRWNKNLSHTPPNALAGRFSANVTGRLERSNAFLVAEFRASQAPNGKIETGGIDQLLKMFKG